MEVWKDIEGYEGYYQVNDCGVVRFIRTTKNPIILRPIVNKLGYTRYLLNVGSVDKIRLAHRLVAKAFIENPLNKPFVHHKDHNPRNNHVSNLEWVTNKENLNYARAIGKWNHVKHASTLTEQDVREIMILLQAGTKVSAIAIAKNVNRHTIYKIMYGVSWNKITGLPKIKYGKQKQAA